MEKIDLIRKKKDHYFKLTILISIIFHIILFFVFIDILPSKETNKNSNNIRFKLNSSQSKFSMTSAKLIEVEDFKLSSKTKINKSSSQTKHSDVSHNKGNSGNLNQQSNKVTSSKGNNKNNKERSSLKYEEALPLWLNRFRKYPQ